MERHPNLLQREKAVLLIIDVQQRLAAVMPEREPVIKRIRTLIQGCQILDLPIYYTEQYPRGLGDTEPELAQLLEPAAPVEKIRFSTCCEGALIAPLSESKRTQLILTGMEAHVCVLQSALDFAHLGYRVHVVIDAVCSRSARDRDAALNRMAAQGISLTTAEMVLFELTETAGSDHFKKIAALVK